LPLDSVVMGFTGGIPDYGIHDKLFPNQIARRMWKFVKSMCENLIYVGEDYAVEGEAILPMCARELVNRHRNKIRVCFLGYCNIDPMQKLREIKNFSKGRNDWLVHESDNKIIDHIVNMVRYSKYIKKECKTYKIKYFDVSRDFNKRIDEAVRYLLKSAR